MTAATTPDERWRLGYRPSLDGLRAIAVLLVMAYHFRVPGFESGGHTGVQVFFTLSGFLITALLLEEHRRTGRVELLAFYMRRARRLVPALCALVAVVLALAAGRGQLADVVPDAAAVLFYLGNWAQHGDPVSLEHLSHTWSLGVEEQFYLVWPLILGLSVAMRRSEAAAAVAVAGIVTALVMRLAGIELGWLARSVDSLMLGCLLAMVMVPGRVRFPAWVGYLGLAGLALALMIPYSGAAGPWAILLIGVATVAIIGPLVSERPPAFTIPLSWPPLVFIGRISYGLYLWHFFVAWEVWPILDGAGWHWLPITLLLSLITFGFALLSWRYVERPAMKSPRFAGLRAKRAASPISP